MINVTIPSIEPELKPRITVFGVGGAGGNAVNNMIKSNLEGVDFVVGNTDAQALKGSLCEKRLQLGTTTTRGLGAGSKPDVGRASAEEQIDEIVQYLDGSNMVFITAGMGGGTGTGAAPVIARAARERGILTVGVVTKPFHFEGAHRMRLAESGISELQQYVDTLIIIPNQNLFRIANEKTTFADAFKMADDVLHSGVRGVTDLMVMPGLINLDFADIRSVMTEMGKAMMGTGEAGGERRAIEAAEAAISNPLLDDVSMKGARGVLINITGGYDMTLFEVDEAANRVRDEVDPDANIIFGSTFDSSLEGTMRVSVVATGIDAAAMANPRTLHPVNLSLVSDRSKPAIPARPSATAGLTAAAPVAPAQGTIQGVSPVPAVPSAATALRQPQPITAGSSALQYNPAQHHQPVQHAAPAQQAPVAAPQVHQQAPAQQAPVQQYQPQVQHTHQAEVPVQQQQPVQQHPHHVEAPRPAGAPLHGESREGHFIAPKPVDAGPRQPMTMGAGPLPTAPMPSAPMAQPQMAPAHEAPARKPNFLFGLVTGLAGRKADPAAHQPAPQQHQPAPQQQHYGHQPHHGQPMVQQPVQHASHPAAPQMAPAPRQPSLGIDGSAQPKIGPSEQEELDIPAFLRRQAN